MKNRFRLLLLAAVFACTAARAENESERLDSVQQAIGRAQQELQQKENARRRADAALQRAKLRLQQLKRELEAITRRQNAAWSSLQKLQTNLESLKTDIAATKAQVARLLNGNYRNRQSHALVLFLKNADAAQKSRFLRYSRHISQANDKVLQRLAEQQRELNRQETAVNAELARLEKLAAASRSKLKQLGQEESKAQSDSRRLSADIDKQNRRLAGLRQDEKRLNQIVAQIAAREAAQRKAEAAQREKAARAKAEQAAKKPAAKNPAGSQNAGKRDQTRERSTLTAEDLALDENSARTEPSHNNDTPDQARPAAKAPEGSGFGRKQGALLRPVSAGVSGRFGSARPSGGVWRGLFFAADHAAVRSVAAGRVEYAADLRGYGNTVIISHGDGYLSVYGGLSSLAVGNGSSVAAGQSIGSSGTLPSGEQGLYFELRYRGRTINPQSWLR
jgi:peptidase, M23 family